MVTSKSEGIHIMAILLRYLPKDEASKMVQDIDFEIGEITDNKSLKSSIKMVREYLEWKPNISKIYGKRKIKRNVD